MALFPTPGPTSSQKPLRRKRFPSIEMWVSLQNPLLVRGGDRSDKSNVANKAAVLSDGSDNFWRRSLRRAECRNEKLPSEHFLQQRSDGPPKPKPGSR